MTLHYDSCRSNLANGLKAAVNASSLRQTHSLNSFGYGRVCLCKVSPRCCLGWTDETPGL